MAKFWDPSFNLSKVIVRTSPFYTDMERFGPKWPWNSKSNHSIYNSHWEAPKIHLISNFVYPSSVLSKVIVRTIDVYGQAVTEAQPTTIPTKRPPVCSMTSLLIITMRTKLKFTTLGMCSCMQSAASRPHLPVYRGARGNPDMINYITHISINTNPIKIRHV